MSQGTPEPRIALDPTVVLPEHEDSAMAVRTGARAPATAPPLAAGDHVGRYVIERQVGVGGMGVVYAARDPQLDRRIAIKVLHRADPDLAQRLAREAVALAKLTHPNVVAVYDAGELDGRVFIAMQFVEGHTMAQELAARPHGWREIVTLYAGAARGLAAAHAAGLVHRDVKPGNILVDPRGEVRVTDFGLARAADDETRDAPIAPPPAHVDVDGVTESSSPSSLLSSPMTQVGAVVGTPAYMAPEQHVGRRSTARSDQFSFCVALWEALYGRHPFLEPRPDESPAAARLRLGEAVLRGELVAPPSGKRVPRRVRRAIERGLATSPERRWASMDALIAALLPPPMKNPWVIAGAILVAGAGVAIAFARGGGGASPPSCRSLASAKIAEIDRTGAIHDRFAHASVSYAASMWGSVEPALGAYDSRWIDLREGACTATRDSAEASQLLGERRVRCLDVRLTALGVVEGMLADPAHPETIDQAMTMVRGLPALDDCADDDALLAGVAPPSAELAPQVAALDTRLAEAKAKSDAGMFQDARPALESLRTDAEQLGYVPTEVAVDQALGELRLSQMDAGSADDFAAAAALATRARLDRDAARALAGQVQAAAAGERGDAVSVLEPLAEAAADRTGDRALIVDEKVREGRALVRLHRLKDAEPVCRQAIQDSEDLYGQDDPRVVEALDCLVETLVPLNRASDAVPLLERAMAMRTKEEGDEHPAIADYLDALASMNAILGKTDEQRAQLERALEIRKRAFGEVHGKVAESMAALADLDAGDGKLDAATKQVEAALAIAVKSDGPDSRLAGQLEHELGTLAARGGDLKGARVHLDRALAIMEKATGPKSLEVGMVLVFEGQVLANDGDAAKAAELDARAVDILDERGDVRLPIALAALGGAEMAQGKYADAAGEFRKALAKMDPTNTAPINRALIHLNLARALARSGGGKDEVRAEAEEARKAAQQAGKDGASLVPAIDAVGK